MTRLAQRLRRLFARDRITLRGRVLARDLIDSPLTGERCVYYRYVVEEWRRPTLTYNPGLAAPGFWLRVDEDEAIVEFYLADGRDRVLVSPERARVEGLRPAPVPAGEGRRASESRLLHGDRIEVTGVLGDILDPLDEGRDYREPPARRVLRAPDGASLRIRRAW